MRRTTDYDQIVARNVRLARESAGLTLTALAKPLGISYQQLQKYESGQNRVSAGMLFEIARILRQPLISFFSRENDASQPTTCTP